MIDGFQQVRKDFGIWRTLLVGLQTATTELDQAYFRYELQLRQKLTLRDIGYWSHFVADASQPVHMSIHYNGWGDYPNPSGYTTAPTYAAAQASGNDNDQTAQPAEVAIVTKQPAASVAELRDEIVDAWRQSEQIPIGYPWSGSPTSRATPSR